jgi:hypothetical protein
MRDKLDRKTYELAFVKEGGHLCVRAKGVRTREAISYILAEILDGCIQHGAAKVLVDVRDLMGRLSIFDSFMIVANEFPNLQRRGVLEKAAIVDRKENGHRFRFFESLARKRGFNLRAFGDTEQATTWLYQVDT